MASASQKITVIKHKDKKKRSTIHVIKKTGYRNITINGTRYYYNANEKYTRSQDIDFNKIVYKNTKATTKPQIIVRRTNSLYESM